ncbi:hypothetical protein PGTUg99_009201 [Puccinia graminis f. sp. tritici]|uniref:Uncharacterized protein n=1 Tax=Puccinia graminis f. sp. tritici TaxID=56615 RepID=A0A5B0RK09_PUCGR|nr:hypothetical protein PGTUg99_009201 [Puccinia graminis f. sp. tritici]
MQSDPSESKGSLPRNGALRQLQIDLRSSHLHAIWWAGSIIRCPRALAPTPTHTTTRSTKTLRGKLFLRRVLVFHPFGQLNTCSGVPWPRMKWRDYVDSICIASFTLWS